MRFTGLGTRRPDLWSQVYHNLPNLKKLSSALGKHPLSSGREKNKEATGAIESLSLICDAVGNILPLC